jgi:hypothetical protein
MISGMFYTMTLCGRYWNRMETEGNWWKTGEHCPELDGDKWKWVETTGSYCIIHGPGSVNPYSYTHVATYVLVTSGAEDRAMSVYLLPHLHMQTEMLAFATRTSEHSRRVTLVPVRMIFPNTKIRSTTLGLII